MTLPKGNRIYGGRMALFIFPFVMYNAHRYWGNYAKFLQKADKHFSQPHRY